MTLSAAGIARVKRVLIAPFPIQLRSNILVSRARRILRAHVYCARRKEGRGKNTSGVFGQVFVCTAGMLAVPIRLQYRVININNT